MRVRAVGIAAQVNRRAKLGEEAFQLFGQDVPEPELPDARSIDDPAAEIQTQELRGGGGVFAFLRGFADFADLQAQAGLDGIEQRRFAHAALAGEYRLPVLQPSSQTLDAHPGRGTGQKGWYAELAVKTHDRLARCRFDQVGLVQAQNRSNAALLGADQIPIDEVWLEVRLHQRHDDD